jgi:hypothetical protein
MSNFRERLQGTDPEQKPALSSFAQAGFNEEAIKKTAAKEQAKIDIKEKQAAVIGEITPVAEENLKVWAQERFGHSDVTITTTGVHRAHPLRMDRHGEHNWTDLTHQAFIEVVDNTGKHDPISLKITAHNENHDPNSQLSVGFSVHGSDQEVYNSRSKEFERPYEGTTDPGNSEQKIQDVLVKSSPRKK